MKTTALPALLLPLAAACASAPTEAGPGAAEYGSVADDGSLPTDDSWESSGDDGWSDDEGSSSESGEPAPVGDPDALDDYILGLGHLPIDPIMDKHEIACPEVCASWPEGEQTCSETFYSETAQLDTFIALQPSSPALWPGAILRGDEVPLGFLSAVGLERGPATFSISLENLNASPIGMMEAPSLSTFREIRNQILAQGVNGATPAQLSYDIKTIKSDSQLSISVGANVNWTGVIDLKALFDWDQNDLDNKYLFDFTQTYYTIDLDAPIRPSSMFDPRVTVEDLQAYMGDGNPPVYVQSISYGRRVLFGLETNESLEAVTAAIDAAVASVLDANVDISDTDSLVGSKITATVLGGDGEAAVETVLGIEQLLAYITTGGNYSAMSPGVPIAYKLAYLDNSTARLALTAEYPEITCQ